MILKAGTYRFNDVLNLPDFEVELGGQFDFTVNDIQYEYMGSLGGSIVRTIFGYATLDYSQIASVYFSDEGWQGDYQSHSILKDADVDETFGTWYITNTNYNEVNKSSLVTISYNGSTIAELNAGETATLSCEGKKMVSDVVVKVNEVEEKEDSPLPTEIATEDEMTALLSTAEVGAVYKYTGESGTYETDALYIVAEGE